MRNEFTAVVERDGRWYVAYCLALILEDGRKDGLRGIPATATREKVVVG
jgi:hypothetical protein